MKPFSAASGANPPVTTDRGNLRKLLCLSCFLSTNAGDTISHCPKDCSLVLPKAALPYKSLDVEDWIDMSGSLSKVKYL